MNHFLALILSSYHPFREACCCCSVAVVSDSLQPHELQHARLPGPSLSPRVCSNTCPLSQWCCLILCPLLLLLPSIFPSIRVFATSQLFTSGGQVLKLCSMCYGAGNHILSPSRQVTDTFEMDQTQGTKEYWGLWQSGGALLQRGTVTPQPDGFFHRHYRPRAATALDFFKINKRLFF